MNSKLIRTVVVDDEQAARQGMMRMLSEIEGIEVVAECRNGIEAIQEIREKNPDLLLLDIQMPGIDGFDVLNYFPKTLRPYTVFITAYDQYAVRAFEFHALDYVLKPYTDERFFEMIERTKKIIGQHKQVEQLQKIEILSNKLQDDRKDVSDFFIMPEYEDIDLRMKKMIVREGGKIHFLKLGEIQYIEAYDYYIKIHSIDTTILARIPLKIMERQLPVSLFLRIHRSFILNLMYLSRLERNNTGDFIAVLSDGNKLKVSNTYKKVLINKIKAEGNQ